MSVGFPVLLADINNSAGKAVVAVWQALDTARLFNLWLQDATHNDAYLNALGITGTSSSGDVQTLRNAFGDLDSLRQIAHGVGAKGVAAIGVAAAVNDFFFYGKNLSGTQNITS